MSIFAYAFNQTALLRRKTSIDSNGDVAYGELEQIRCRFDYKQTESINKEGHKDSGGATLFTGTEIQPLDIIKYDERWWTVTNVTVVRNLAGKIDHWEAVL